MENKTKQNKHTHQKNPTKTHNVFHYYMKNTLKEQQKYPFKNNPIIQVRISPKKFIQH